MAICIVGKAQNSEGVGVDINSLYSPVALVWYHSIVLPHICTPITGSTLAEFEHHLKLTQEISDFVELRIDSIPDLTQEQLTRLHSLTYQQAICTCRVTDQGGMGGVDETRRIRIIHHALTLGFAYIDIEYETYTTHQFVLPPRTKLVISAHIFTHTPPAHELQDLIRRMSDLDPAVIKIATMVKAQSDLELIYSLLKKHQQNTSHQQLLLIGMGEQGRESRIQGPLRGCPWTYASTPWGSTAPGQLSLAEMKQIYTQMKDRFVTEHII